MEDKIQHSKPVPPFVRFCAANIPMVFDDSLSYYECLCALWNWLQTDVINVINNNATVTQKWREELTEFEGNVNDEIEEFESDMRSDFSDLNDAFDTLKNWVEDYFDNLDVQQEINNKLDAMVEDGTLQELINNYLQPNVTWTFDNVADMQASENLISGGYAKTLGYYAKGDNGGAVYYINTTGTADGGEVIAIGDTLKAHLLIQNNEVNVRQFGAKGDGTTNDTSAFTKAIAAANTVIVPAGNYDIDSITLDKNIKIVGTMPTGRWDIGAGSIITCDDDYAFKGTWPYISNFSNITFRGLNGIYEPCNGLIDHCEFDSLGIGIRHGRATSIHNCTFKQCSTAGMQWLTDCEVDNCDFRGCENGIHMAGGGNDQVANCRFEWGNIGIKMEAHNHSTFTGNMFDRNTLYGMQIDESCHYNTIVGNTFQRNLENHMKGYPVDTVISSNMFMKKYIIDGDTTSDVKPNVAFDFSNFQRNTFTGNVIYAEKFNKSYFSTDGKNNTFSSNVINNKSMDSLRVKIGNTTTIAAGGTGSVNATWSTLKNNILGIADGNKFKLAQIEVIMGNNYVYWVGSTEITNIIYDKWYQIQVNLKNNTGDSHDYEVFAIFKDINPFAIDMTSA